MLQLFAGLVTFALLVQPVFKPLKTVYQYGLYRLSCDFPAPLTELLKWLDTHTTREGRILIEDSECDTFHQYYGAHFPALFPEYVQREYLCGPRPMYPIKHSYASFTAGLLFEKKIEDYTLEELQRNFDIYNVGWIVCWCEESKKVFDRFPAYLVKAGDIDTFTLYEVKRTPSFFLKGRGTVQSDYNRLELTGVVPEDDPWATFVGCTADGVSLITSFCMPASAQMILSLSLGSLISFSFLMILFLSISCFLSDYTHLHRAPCLSFSPAYIRIPGRFHIIQAPYGSSKRR